MKATKGSRFFPSVKWKYAVYKTNQDGTVKTIKNKGNINNDDDILKSVAELEELCLDISTKLKKIRDNFK